jgi:cysteine desulfurase
LTKLNSLQYKNMQNLHISSDLSLGILKNNNEFESLTKEFKSKYSFGNLKTFSFDKDSFLGLLLELNKQGSIAISVGETHALIEAGKAFEELGFKLIWIDLNKDGKVNMEQIKNSNTDFLFLSSYVMDTFVKTNIQEIKKQTKAKIISNASANFDKNSDVIYFDSYKLTGFSSAGVLLFDDELFSEQSIGFINTIAVYTIFEALKTQVFERSVQKIFKEKLQNTFKDDIYFFVDSSDVLEYTLHFALKNIKAREMIRTLGLNEIHITNGEGCSLGLSQPSRIIQAMGYDELTSRNALSLTFTEILSEEEVEKIVNIFAKKYRQIIVLNQGK